MRIRPAFAEDVKLLTAWVASGHLRDVSWARFNPSLPIHVAIIEVDGVPVGGVTVFDIDVHHQSAEISCYIVDPERRGWGAGLLAARSMMQRAFDHYPINRIQAQTLASNHVVNAIMKRSGFVREGTRREAVVIDGTPHHVAVWSMLRREFDARWRR